MASPLYAAPWSPRLNFIVHGKKPRKYCLPGLEIVTHGRIGSRDSRKDRHVWRCCFDGLYSN